LEARFHFPAVLVDAVQQLVRRVVSVRDLHRDRIELDRLARADRQVAEMRELGDVLRVVTPSFRPSRFPFTIVSSVKSIAPQATVHSAYGIIIP